MSYLPELADDLQKTKLTLLQLINHLPTTHTLPISPYVDHSTQTTNHSSGNQIFLNHPLLPPMREYALLGNTLNGHEIGADWIYTCWGQPFEGLFYLRGAPGVFVMGGQRWVTNHGENDADFRYMLTVNTVNGSVRTRVLQGTDQVTISLNTGDTFWLTYVYDSSVQSAEYERVEISADSRFLLTRLSTAA